MSQLKITFRDFYHILPKFAPNFCHQWSSYLQNPNPLTFFISWPTPFQHSKNLLFSLFYYPSNNLELNFIYAHYLKFNGILSIFSNNIVIYIHYFIMSFTSTTFATKCSQGEKPQHFVGYWCSWTRPVML